MLHLQVSDNYRAFDKGIAACGGCIPSPDLAQLRSRGDNLQRVAVGSYAVGGAALVAGAVFLYLNRPQLDAPVEEGVRVAPFLVGETRGALAFFQF